MEPWTKPAVRFLVANFDPYPCQHNCSKCYTCPVMRCPLLCRRHAACGQLRYGFLPGWALFFLKGGSSTSQRAFPLLGPLSVQVLLDPVGPPFRDVFLWQKVPTWLMHSQAIQSQWQNASSLDVLQWLCELPCNIMLTKCDAWG